MKTTKSNWYVTPTGKLTTMQQEQDKWAADAADKIMAVGTRYFVVRFGLFLLVSVVLFLGVCLYTFYNR